MPDRRQQSDTAFTGPRNTHLQHLCIEKGEHIHLNSSPRHPTEAGSSEQPKVTFHWHLPGNLFHLSNFSQILKQSYNLSNRIHMHSYLRCIHSYAETFLTFCRSSHYKLPFSCILVGQYNLSVGGILHSYLAIVMCRTDSKTIYPDYLFPSHCRIHKDGVMWWTIVWTTTMYVEISRGSLQERKPIKVTGWHFMLYH